jgi:hypothetical protein
MNTDSDYSWFEDLHGAAPPLGKAHPICER